MKYYLLKLGVLLFLGDFESAEEADPSGGRGNLGTVIPANTLAQWQAMIVRESRPGRYFLRRPDISLTFLPKHLREMNQLDPAYVYDAIPNDMVLSWLNVDESKPVYWPRAPKEKPPVPCAPPTPSQPEVSPMKNIPQLSGRDRIVFGRPEGPVVAVRHVAESQRGDVRPADEALPDDHHYFAVYRWDDENNKWVWMADVAKAGYAETFAVMVAGTVEQYRL